MTNKKQKLELTWIGKDDELRLEPRILIEDPNKSYGDPNSENMLIHGDNLLALKALEQDFTNRIKCIYIDPPYNTGSAFEHYDDNLEHSTWLSLMRPRLEILNNLLSEEGVIFVQLDDNEAHYCKIILDEIFLRTNFITSIAWKRRASQANLSKFFAPIHDHILVYAKDKQSLILNKIALRQEYVTSMYKNPDNDPRGLWRTKPLLQGKRSKNAEWTLKLPDGRDVIGRWRCTKETYGKYLADNRIYVPKDGVPNIKIFLNENNGQVPNTFWDNMGTNEEAGSEIENLFGDKTEFETPKPEKLIARILEISSKTGDWVLDSFLGSGTTSAVANKMGRKHIGIEFGEHAVTHCLPRLKKVVDGNDGLPLSEALGWKGGGGFKFYKLAPSLLRKDNFGNFVIDEKYNANMLAAAMCKHEGFKYSPDETSYWKQGKSTETDYIFVTTGFVTVEQLDAIQAQMTENESLLICTKSFAPESENHFSNITIKKIPQMILGKCEFGKDNYDLNIIKADEQ
jgi:adenine-specific DNA-methyltransferase